jgi:hypothetical protein
MSIFIKQYQHNAELPSLGQEMDFTIWAQKEPILRLPLHNDDGFKRQFEALAAELRARS